MHVPCLLWPPIINQRCRDPKREVLFRCDNREQGPSALPVRLLVGSQGLLVTREFGREGGKYRGFLAGIKRRLVLRDKKSTKGKWRILFLD